MLPGVNARVVGACDRPVTMEVETKAHGTCTRLTIAKSAAFGATKDLQQVPLPVDAQPCPPKEDGTTVTLRIPPASGSHPLR